MRRHLPIQRNTKYPAIALSKLRQKVITGRVWHCKHRSPKNIHWQYSEEAQLHNISPLLLRGACPLTSHGDGPILDLWEAVATAHLRLSYRRSWCKGQVGSSSQSTVRRIFLVLTIVSFQTTTETYVPPKVLPAGLRSSSLGCGLATSEWGPKVFGLDAGRLFN